MTILEFKKSVTLKNKPDVNPLLTSLWLDAVGQWDKAHNIVQDIPGESGALVHAYLHRKEGDMFNAGYWYRRANRGISQYSLEKEWEEIVNELL